MAVWSFTEAIMAGRPIKVFNHGDMRRDLTYIDDIVGGVVAALDRPPEGVGSPSRIFNLGNNRAVPLLRLVEVLEDAIGRKAKLVPLPMQPGDVQVTYADISSIEAVLGFRPTTPIEEGLPRFVEWYRSYRNA